MQSSGCKRRKPQRGRTAQTPVGDQHPTGLAKALIAQLQIQAHIIKGNTAAGCELPGLKREAEQRRHRWHHLVTQRRGQLAAAGVTAGGQHHATGSQGLLQAAALNQKPTLRMGRDLLHHRPQLPLHPRGRGSLLQAADHRFRSVLLGEQASVGLLHQRETAFIKPGDRITTGEATERTAQGPAAARIVAGQLARIPAGMGHIAAASATDAHLLQRLRSAFQHQHPNQTLLGSGDRCHGSGRTTTNNDQIKQAGSARQLRCCNSACRLAGGRH